MGLFSKSKEPLPSNQEEKIYLESMDSVSDLCGLNSLSDRVGNEITKSMSLYDFQTATIGDQGGYFGGEFNIQSTVSRLKGLYATEPWAFATACLIAKTLSTVPFRVRNPSTKDWLEEHPLQSLIDSGNTMQDGKSLDWSGYVDLIMGGNFIKVISEDYTTPYHLPIEYADLKLREVKGSEDKIKLETVGPIDCVEINGGSTVNLVGGKSSIPYEYVIHHKFPNPFNPLFGLSLYTAASRPMLLDRYKNEFEMAFYLRGATNAGVIETTEDLTKSRMERLMRTFEQAFTGKRNWWRTLFLPKGAKWVNSGLTMSEMQHLEGLRENRRTLLAVLGIPPVKVGIVEDVNRSTSEVQESTFWENSIIPLANFVAAGWNNSYLVREIYGCKVEVAPDFSGISAVEGSLASKGEDILAVREVLTVNEIREDILGYEPLDEGDKRGNKFVTEIGPSFSNPFAMDDSEDSEEDPAPENEENDGEENDNLEDQKPDDKSADKERLKATIANSQERIEKKQTKKFVSAYDSYIKFILLQAREALKNGNNVRAFLETHREKRAEIYTANAMPILLDTQELGFVLGKVAAKSFSAVAKKQFSEVDEQAIEVIRDKTRDGQRQQLAARAIDSFLGFDETRTELIMGLIESGLKDGKTTEQIAKDLEINYGETYGDQAFTIARTEVLHAVSQGLQWNQDTLGQVFSEVNKQWFHVGDTSTNPDARDGHAEFENHGKDGVVPKDYIWVNEYTGARLRYPRDFQGGAGDVINCRCSMANVIPVGSVSNAEAILATE